MWRLIISSLNSSRPGFISTKKSGYSPPTKLILKADIAESFPHLTNQDHRRTYVGPSTSGHQANLLDLFLTSLSLIKVYQIFTSTGHYVHIDAKSKAPLDVPFQRKILCNAKADRDSFWSYMLEVPFAIFSKHVDLHILLLSLIGSFTEWRVYIRNISSKTNQSTLFYLWVGCSHN